MARYGPGGMTYIITPALHFMMHQNIKTKANSSSQITCGWHPKPINMMSNVMVPIQKLRRRHLAPSGVVGQWGGGELWKCTKPVRLNDYNPKYYSTVVLAVTGHYFTGTPCLLTVMLQRNNETSDFLIAVSEKKILVLQLFICSGELLTNRRLQYQTNYSDKPKMI